MKRNQKGQNRLDDAITVVVATVILSKILSSSLPTFCNAFTGIERIVTVRQQYASSSSSSSTLLNGMMAPPLIIGPMIKKMREENAKKRMPTAPTNRDEAREEAPGLRVGRDVWKWPPYWPYDESIFKSKQEIELLQQKASANNNPSEALGDMASILSGVAQVPKSITANVDEEKEEIYFDALKYWGTEQAETKTNLDSDAILKLKEHYAFYLPPNASILEFGAAENSYLPDNYKPRRHVGIGAAKSLMDSNPSLTEKLIIDLNKVVVGRDIDSDALRSLAQIEQFDVILMSNTVDYLNYPREVFRSAWYLLKPGGLMIVSFSGKETELVKNQFVDAQTKIWRDYNDDQHLWITGSFFQFSAGDGWENLLGFDISPESAKKITDNPVVDLLSPGKNNQLYVVQATKGFQYNRIDRNNIEESISSLCWMLPVMEERDKSLVIPRLARIYETTDSEEVRRALERNIQALPIIYEQALTKMDTFAFSFSNQAQMAADLIADPAFDVTNEQQIIALKQGLGLRTPSKEFWIPIGTNTGSMQMEDRISLLAYIVPKFGSNNPIQEDALQAFADGLVPTYNLIKSKCPMMSDGDIQLLGTELLASEILQIGRSTPREFAIWLDCMTSDELVSIVNGRKQLRIMANENYIDYRKAKAAEKERLEEYKRKYDEQVAMARMERSLIFNPRTQKMQIFDNPNKKKENTFPLKLPQLFGGNKN